MLYPDPKGTTIMKIVSTASVAERCAERQGNCLQCMGQVRDNLAYLERGGEGQLSPTED